MEGECTGYARCTLERCQERLKSEQKKFVFPIQQLHREGMLKRNLHRHLEYYHMTDEEFEAHKLNKRKTQGRSKSKESQMSMMNFVHESKKSSLREVLKKILRFDILRAQDVQLFNKTQQAIMLLRK